VIYLYPEKQKYAAKKKKQRNQIKKVFDPGFCPMQKESDFFKKKKKHCNRG
jgi:hypothetical protein